jgi:sodium transport system permease protein
VTMFYGSLLLEKRGPVTMLLGTQLGLMLPPVLLATALLRLSPRRTLALRPPSAQGLLASVLIGLSGWTFAAGVLMRFVPPPDDLVKALQRQTLLSDPTTPLALVLLCMALVPATCEELLFRGFILSGLRGLGAKAAIGVTALLFGLAHASIHRLLPTAFLGLVVGIVAWRTGSIACCILVHALNNGLAAVIVRTPALSGLVGTDDKVLPPSITAAGFVVLCLGLLLLRGCRPPPDPEEPAKGQ